MTQIVGFVGKKQSGKDTSCNFLLAMKLAELNVCDVSRINDDGEVEVSDVLGEKDPALEWIPFKPPHVDVDGLFESELGQFIRIYALAGTLKDMAVQILGLSPEQAYGTDVDKNTLTDLFWENMPGIISATELKNQKISKKAAATLGLTVHESGAMTGREVLQYVGTDMFRKMNSNVWLDSLFRKIKEDSPELALISDVRFLNEAEWIKRRGGFLVGLDRNPSTKEDSHASEKAVEECLVACDIVIENSKMTIAEQNKEIYQALSHLENAVPRIED